MHADFHTFWRSAVALVEGRDIYHGGGAALPNLNPPIFTALLAPYGLLDFWTAYRLFTLVSLTLLVASMLMVAAELRMRGAPTGAVLTRRAAVLADDRDLRARQTPMLTAGQAATWMLERRGQHSLAGTATIGTRDVRHDGGHARPRPGTAERVP